MKSFLLVALAVAIGSLAATAQVEPFFVAGKKGIYLETLDAATGRLAAPTLSVAGPQPLFLALSPTRSILYGSYAHTLAAFSVNGQNALAPMGEVDSGGEDTCHLTLDRTGRYVLSVNYDTPSLACLALKADGSLGARLSLTPFTGSGPNPQRQEKAHAHSVYVDASNRHVYVCDLGSDRVWIFNFDPANGALSPADPPSIVITPGSGPRHLAFDTTGNIAYVNGELGANLSIFAHDPATGRLTPLGVLSTLTPPQAPPAQGGTAEIVLHPNGKWLYVSNRLGNTMAVFVVTPDGRAKLIQDAPSVADEVRSFWIDPAGKWIVAAGQHDNRVVVLKIDAATGKLSPTDQSQAIEEPICVLFKGGKA